MAKVILTTDHRTLGKEGTEIEIPEGSVQVWLESGKAKLPDLKNQIKNQKKKVRKSNKIN